MRFYEFITESSIKLSGDNSMAKSWIEKVYAKYPYTMQNNHVMVWGKGDDQQFAMFELIPSMSKRGAVEVKWFQAYPLRQGVGSRAMKELQAMAQADGIALTLFPWDKGQVSQSKLTKFYKGHGFEPTVKGSKSLAWTPVTEAFDQPYPLTWEKSEYGDVDALARLQDGTHLSIMFNREDDEWQVEFYRNNSQDVTGEGDAQRVFATVLTAIQQFIEKEDPERIRFSATKEDDTGNRNESRSSLYTRLVKRYASQWGYMVDTSDFAGTTVYQLERLR